jgi:acetate---CoA ligase (ADP-forming)
MTDSASSLAPFFNPDGVAIIGASRDPAKLSYGVIRNLLDPEHRYPGPVYPVNPKASEILGLPCYPDIASVPDPVELAVLIIPAGAVADAIEQCGRRGIKAAVVISGGFREVGPEGAAREAGMLAVARRYGMRVIGPNGIGVIDTYTPLNTTFVKGMPGQGHIAFLSQSGALCGGVIDWTVSSGIGFSRLLSVGNEADVNETDVLRFLADDERTRVISLYLEDVKGGPAFVAALAAAAAVKPVVVLKAGRTGGGQAATASHTGALASSHAAFRAACQQTGAVEVEKVQALFDASLAFAYQPLPGGNRVAIVTNAGGPAALAADALEPAGLRLARTSEATQSILRGIVHPDAQVSGPVDLLGGADEQGYRAVLDAVLADPACDAVLAVLVPQALVNPLAVVEAWGAAIRAQGDNPKPLLACLMGEASLGPAFAAAHRLAIPAHTFPEDAVASLAALWSRSAHLQRARDSQLPTFNLQPETFNQEKVAAAKARRAVQQSVLIARGAGRLNLDSHTCRPLIEAYGIPFPRQGLAIDPEDAAEFSAEIGYPVALKLISPDILHKSDIGGVILDVQDDAGVRQAFVTILERAKAAHPDAHIRGVQVQKMVTGGREVILGLKADPTFGPLIMFGLGGVFVEALADVSFRLAPLTRDDAEQMIGEVRAARLLDGLRGTAPADRPALADAIVRLGRFAADHPEVVELDINPLLVMPAGQGVLAVDARMILAPG